MIKGVHKNVVFVGDVENDLFEQAIFILKPQAMERNKVDRESIVMEAQKILDNYAAKQGMVEINLRQTHKKSGIATMRKRRQLLYYGGGAMALFGIISGVIAFL